MTTHTAYQRAVIGKELVKKHNLYFIKLSSGHVQAVLKVRGLDHRFKPAASEHSAIERAISVLHRKGKIDWDCLEVHL